MLLGRYKFNLSIDIYFLNSFLESNYNISYDHDNISDNIYDNIRENHDNFMKVNIFKKITRAKIL
jgi:hypothetical protein